MKTVCSATPRKLSYLVCVFFLFVVSCTPPELPPPVPIATTSTVPFGNDHFVQQIGETVVEINGITDAPVTLTVPDDMTLQMSSTIDPAIVQFVTEDSNPDVLVSVVEGEWSADASSLAYHPILVRYGFVAGEARSTRKIELHDRMASVVPRYITAPAPATTVATVAHMRDFHIINATMFERVAEAVNLERPQYIYLLGDMVNKRLMADYVRLEDHFINKVSLEPWVISFVYVPGNHEWLGFDGFDAPPFYDYFGVHPPVITTDHVNLVSLRSMQIIEDVEADLEAAFNLVDESKPNWLMLHHHVWDIRFPDSSFTPKWDEYEFMPLVQGKVETIVSGDKSVDIFIEEEAFYPEVTGYAVGSSRENRITPIFFALMSIGADEIVRIKRIYVDFAVDHPYY